AGAKVRYPSARMLAMTFSRVSGRTGTEPVTTFETVRWETPACSATSRIVTATGPSFARIETRPRRGCADLPSRTCYVAIHFSSWHSPGASARSIPRPEYPRPKLARERWLNQHGAY